MSSLAIVDAFSDLPDVRRTAGLRHHQALCLALFTLAVAAGNRGFLAIGDWLKSYHAPLLELFNPPKNRLPSYSTIRWVLLQEVDHKTNEIKALPGLIEQLALKGVVFACDAINTQKNSTVDY